jgi:hypothetical protein
MKAFLNKILIVSETRNPVLMHKRIKADSFLDFLNVNATKNV